MFIKIIASLMIIGAASFIGIILAGFKVQRVKHLREVISALNMFQIEVSYALTLLPDLFIKISKVVDEKIGAVFSNVANQMISQKRCGCDAWMYALKNAEGLYLNSEDKEILFSLGRSLGEIDIENQIRSIDLVVEQLKNQEVKAEEDRKKNEKLFKNLGLLFGLAIVIVFY